MKGIADTGFLVAFANRRDAHHRWAADLASRITEPLLTCESVLSEAAFHIGECGPVLQFLDRGLIALAFEVEAHRPELAKLALRYRDRQPDFTDLCLVRMSELFPHHAVFTVDGDFRVYRRNQREVIPLVMPPPRPTKKLRYP